MLETEAPKNVLVPKYQTNRSSPGVFLQQIVLI